MASTLKVLAFTEASPAMISTGTMLNRCNLSNVPSFLISSAAAAAVDCASTSFLDGCPAFLTVNCCLLEGSYDKMEALLEQNIHPVDILLLMAASEGDKPKIEELMRAGADYTVKDAEGRTALERAVSDEIKDFILGVSAQKA
ncbi:protein LHCP TRANSLOCATION DEFECT [Sesamum angolense]|uniref:Protein LHCP TRANSLOCATION DEFECT n=1 Tax=Sesamum angolense TaxID=2727404 RepID=A0AAE1WSK1_9LAMI|nr:protein LHCP TRANSLOCATION DEFECT [Sesamum angolense]